MRIATVVRSCFILVVGCILSAGCPPSAFIRGGHHGQIRHGGPPAHAPAHGRRAQYTYWYYPSAEVYFDSGRGLYFYYYGGTWVSRATLPTTIVVSSSSRVSIEMDSARPYLKHAQHKAKYHKGKTKKKNKNRIKIKRKSKGKDKEEIKGKDKGKIKIKGKGKGKEKKKGKEKAKRKGKKR